MTLLVQAANIGFAYGGRHIFEDVSFEVRTGDRVALIGANGSGKSTLFKLMARRLSPDGGVVTHGRNLVVGYLSQAPEGDQGLTVRQMVAVAAGDPATLEAQLRELELQMEQAATVSDDELASVLETYGDALARLEACSGPGHTPEVRVTTALAGLGIPESLWDRPVGTLSGGEKKMVSLAQVVVGEPDLLLLDEPDNHLDAEGKIWLEQFIASHRGAVALISHDRWFIDRSVNRIFELEHGAIEGYPGNYSAYVKQKREQLERRAQLRDLQEREFRKLKASAEQLTQWARQNPKFATRAENQRRKMAEERARLEETPAPVLSTRRIEVGFDTERGGTLVLEADELAMSYGERVVFRPFDLVIRHGEAVGLVGPNGAGKTTFFRLVLGREQPTAGILRSGPRIKVGYYAQEQETLDPRSTAMEMVRQLRPLTEQQALSFLVGYLFDRETALAHIGDLSGGEQARLQVAGLVLRGANFLLLDEPTNNLDIPSIEALEAALLAFPGTLLAISHDRYFLDRVCTRILELDAGTIRDYPGSFSYYLTNRDRGKALNCQEREDASMAAGPRHRRQQRGPRDARQR